MYELSFECDVYNYAFHAPHATFFLQACSR
jgi:hypothetical protein